MNADKLLRRELWVDEQWQAFCDLTADASTHADAAGSLIGSPEDARRRLHMARAALNAAERTLDGIEYGVRT